MLNSNDVFIIATKSSASIWCGKGSTGDERETAKQLCQAMKREPIMVFEGQEKDDFWQEIGGKEPYSNEKRLQTPTEAYHSARLFELSNASGKINVQEVFQFNQVIKCLTIERS